MAFWLHLFFQLFDYAINNAHILYKHSCKRYDVRPKDLLAFRLELLHLLLDEVSLPKGVTQSSASVGRAQSERVCYLEKVSKIGLKVCVGVGVWGRVCVGVSVCERLN